MACGYLVSEHPDQPNIVLKDMRECTPPDGAGSVFLIFLRFHTQATWLRTENDTSPVLERLLLENYRKRHQRNEAHLSLPTCTHRKSGKTILPTGATTLNKTELLLQPITKPLNTL